MTWDDKTIARFQTRVRIFTRRGWAEGRAERLAERLVTRDLQRDDRRACIECSHLLRSGFCAEEKRRTKLSTAPALAYPPLRSPFLDETLHRCSSFSWTS